MDLNLSNKVIIYTGAAGLLGYKTSLELVKQGAHLVAIDINQEKLTQLELNIKETYPNSKCLFFSNVDSLSANSIDSILENVIKKFSKIDCLINSAYPRTKDWSLPFEEIPFSSWQKNVDDHMNSYFLFSQRCSLKMIPQKFGNIIFFSSIYGSVGPDFSIYNNTNGMTNPAAYSAIKGGIVNYCRYLASYLGRYNIRTNCISPGGIEDNQNSTFIENYCQKVPLRKMGKPEDIIGPLLFLISELSGYITGTNLMVDGGWTAI